MKRLLWVIALCAMSAAAQLPTGTIAGQVLLRDGQPAAGIRVSAMAVPDPAFPANNATALVSLAMTDTSGRYRLENIPAGRYYVVAGFVDAPTYFPGVSSAAGATILNLLSGTPIQDVNFTIAVSTGVTVSGRFVGDLRGIEGVRLLSGARTVETTGTPDGSFEFSRVRPGTYQLSAIRRPTLSPTTIVVGDQDLEVEVPVLAAFPISGNVVVPDNGVRPGFTITFTSLSGGAIPPRNAARSANGAFRAVLDEGEYRVGWSGLPAGYELKSITAGAADLLSTTLSVSAATASIPVVVNLGVAEKPPWVKAAGRVSGLEGLPSLRNLRIYLAGSPAWDSLEIPLNPDGSFEFSRVLPGSYTAILSPGLPVPPRSLTIPNEATSNLDISIPSMKEVRGVVSNHSSNVTVRLIWIEPGLGTTAASVSIRLDGNFTVVMPVGERSVTLSVPGYAVQSFTYGSQDLLKESMKISATDTFEFRAVVASPYMTR